MNDTDWISVADQLPCRRPENQYDKNEMWVLASNGHDVWQSQFIIYGDPEETPSWYCPSEVGFWRDSPVTHWRPLPGPPVALERMGEGDANRWV